MATTDFTEDQRERRRVIFDAITRGDLTIRQRYKLAALVEITLIIRDSDDDNARTIAWDVISSDVDRVADAMTDTDAEQAVSA